MSTEELESAVQQLFPTLGKNALATALGIDPSTLWRYAQRGRIPGPVSAAIAAWLVLKRDFDLDPPEEPCSTREIEEMAEMTDPGIRRRSGLLGIEAAAFVVFGDGWKGRLAAALGVDYSTIWRQITAGNIQGPVMAAIRAWVVLKRLGGTLPDNSSDVPRVRCKSMPKYAKLLLEDD